jgi:protein-S-isoprenylcysteine O-methyltransferase Ste14
MPIKTDIARSLYRWRVRASLISVIATVILARPNWLSLLAGAGFITLGLLFRGWACGHLTKDRELTTSGPYRYTRNPLYLGSLWIALGITAAARSWWVAALFALNFLLFYPVAIYKERKVMEDLFPGSYSAYSREVPLFFPFRRPYTNARIKSFSWDLYKSNKEYRALVGALIFLLFMGIRIFI